LCFSVRKALGPCRSVPGIPRARVPVLPAPRRVSLGWVFSSACDTLLVVWLPCSVVCPGFVLLCLLPPNSPRTSRPFHAYALRCLILLIVLRTFSVYPACCIHSCTDAKTSAWFAFSWYFYRLPLLAVLACSVTGPPGYCLHHPPVFNYRCTCCHGVRGGDTGSPAFSSSFLSLPVEPLFLPSCHSLQIPFPILAHAA